MKTKKTKAEQPNETKENENYMAETKCDFCNGEQVIETPSDAAIKEKNTSQMTEHQPEGQIKLSTMKTTLAKRPWTFGAVKVNTQTEDGKVNEVWVAAVIDADGKAVCCGDTPDIEFIVKLENSYDQILSLLNTQGKTIGEAIDVLSDFECKKTKAFKFNG